MARKSRRARRRSKARPLASDQVSPSQSTTSAAASRAASIPVTRRPKGVNLAEEYAYVVSDLRRIAIIAVGMLAVLIALSYVIR